MRTFNRKEIVVFWLTTKKLIKATCFSSVCRLIREIQIADFLFKMYLFVGGRLDEGNRAFKAVDGTHQGAQWAPSLHATPTAFSSLG